jgi:inhibitor of cysteine peptidase
MNGMMRIVKILVGIAAALALLTACGSKNEVKIGAEANGGSVELKSGQVLAVTLESNPSTGYTWEAVQVDDELLKSQGEAEYRQADGQPRVGAGGAETLRFLASGTGETTLKLVYHRAWEKDADPLRTYTLQVMVQ